MKDFKFVNPFLKKRMIELSDGTMMSTQEYIDAFVLPVVGNAKSIRLSTGQVVSLNVFINQYVLTDCLNKYNGDFDKFYFDYVSDNISRFFSRNNINIEDISKMPESYMYNMNDLNPIVAKHGIYKNPIYSQISVADIIGVVSEPYDYDKQSIVNNLNLYFSRHDEKILSYNSRANGMLDYSRDNILSGLYSSFKKEPIVVAKLENGKALVSENGLHRYHLLRTFYLDELSKTNNNDTKEKLKEKYVIPVKVEMIDYIKTYSNFLLKLTGSNFNLSVEKNENNEKTQYSVLKFGSKCYVLTDQQLIEVVRANMDKINVDSQMLHNYYEKIPSFNHYINLYFPEFVKYQTESRGGRS